MALDTAQSRKSSVDLLESLFSTQNQAWLAGQVGAMFDGDVAAYKAQDRVVEELKKMRNDLYLPDYCHYYLMVLLTIGGPAYEFAKNQTPAHRFFPFMYTLRREIVVFHDGHKAPGVLATCEAEKRYKSLGLFVSTMRTAYLIDLPPYEAKAPAAAAAAAGPAAPTLASLQFEKVVPRKKKKQTTQKKAAAKRKADEEDEEQEEKENSLFAEDEDE